MTGSDFPGHEDYETGRSPVRDLELLDQVKYWKARARLAEECAHENLQRVHEIEEDHENGDWWKYQ